MSDNLSDMIKKYWEDQYRRQQGGRTINALSDKLTNLFGPFMNNRPQLDPNYEWGDPSEWIPTPMGTAAGISFNPGGATPRNVSITSLAPRVAPNRAPRKGSPSPVSTSRIRPPAPNLANDARFMDPNVNVDEINARFRSQVAAANAPSPQDDIMAQIESILNQQHGTPDRWVSPYTQADLDRIGAGLLAAGNDAQQQFQASQADIDAIYDEAINRRAGIQSDLASQLASNLSNIGVQPGAAEADAVAAQQFLNTTSNQNRAADQAFNEKLGTMTQALASQLANAARAGLLTPKQFVRGDAGSMSDANKFRLGMLQDQLNAASGNTSDTTITETLLNNNPLVPQMIANIEDPALREEAARLYDQFGDPNAVLAELANRQKQPRTINNPINLPMGIGKSFDPFFNEVNAARQATYDQQVMMNSMLTDLFRQIASNWQGVPTSREIKQKSS